MTVRRALSLQLFQHYDRDTRQFQGAACSYSPSESGDVPPGQIITNTVTLPSWLPASDSAVFHWEWLAPNPSLL